MTGPVRPCDTAGPHTPQKGHPVKALTIRQPWAGAIVHQTKRIENRTWKLPASMVGTRFLVHAGAERDKLAVVYGPNLDVYGAIIGAATLTGCHYSDDSKNICCSEWAFPGVYHWQLNDVVALDQPVPAKGALGFWTPIPDVITAVFQQLDDPTT